jgi:cytoskeletal protein CcmA (bactofilin family)
MWGRKEDSSTTTPETPAARPASPLDTSRPSPSGAVARSAASADRSARTQAQIGKTLKLKGEMTGSEDVYVDGEVDGTVELRENNLTVGPNGNVRANVKARSITVLGRLEGNVQAGERIEIRKTGSLVGDLVTPRIVIEDGAVFRGSIDILKQGATTEKPAPPQAEKRPASRPPTPQTATAAASVGQQAAASTGKVKDVARS